MKKVSYLMIEKFNLPNLGYDFMGYNFDEIKELSFHHLIVPRRNCKEKGLGRGFVEWNGAEFSYEDFMYVTEKNNRADELANMGIDELR